jgi:hypothetical protein
VSGRGGRPGPLSRAALVFVVVFVTVWAALTCWTAMYGNAVCMVAALAAWWAAYRYLRPFVRRGRR